MKDKYGRTCFVANLLVLLTLIALCVIPIIIFVKRIWVILILIVLAIVLCAFIEERILSRYVNGLITKMEDKADHQ